jgi:hypothetical protein
MLRQQDFEQRYAFDPLYKSCFTTGSVNLVAMIAGGVPQTVLDQLIPAAETNGWIWPDGGMKNLPAFSGDLLARLGKSGYLDFVYDYQNGGNRLSYADEAEFRSSGYKYGMGNYYNFETRQNHFALFYPGGINDPLGARPQTENYRLKWVAPVQWLGR